MKVMFNDREWDIDESKLQPGSGPEDRQIVMTLESEQGVETSTVVIAAKDGNGTAYYIAEVLNSSWTEDGVRDHLKQQLILKDEPAPELAPEEVSEAESAA